MNNKELIAWIWSRRTINKDTQGSEKTPVININTNKKFKMYRRAYDLETNTTLEVNQQYEGESIEQKVDRIVNNNEPISDGAPTIWTERKDGVRPEFNIRTDRFELAVEGMDIHAKSRLAERQKGIAERESKVIDMKTGKDGTPQGGTENGG